MAAQTLKNQQHSLARLSNLLKKMKYYIFCNSICKKCLGFVACLNKMRGSLKEVKQAESFLKLLEYVNSKTEDISVTFINEAEIMILRKRLLIQYQHLKNLTLLRDFCLVTDIFMKMYSIRILHLAALKKSTG